MKLSPKQNKWVKILLILFAIGLIFGSLLYYVVVKKFENIIQLTIAKESNGLYFFEAANVKLNLVNKSIQVKNAEVGCTDTTQVQSFHELRAPKMYLRVHSWLDLILHKKLIVDSLDIDFPSLTTYDHVKDKKEEKSIAFHASSIFDILQKLATNLEIRSLKIQNGEYTYSNNKNDKAFTCNHIFLNIKNFSKKEGKITRLFSSDDIDISLYNQHWKLANGTHDISFKRVHFSGKKQFFELDTCSFHKAAEAGKSEITLFADQFYFNSKRLTAIHEQEELLIDTLICFRPVLSFIPADKKHIIPDSIGSISQSIKGIFKNINFKYIDIREGQLTFSTINRYDTLNATKTNLKIYNLTINPIIEPHITTDSIKLNLNKILFYTKDSLYQLSVDEFKLHNNDIIFINAEYSPTSRNHSGKAITFTASSLLLKNIDLEELAKKKLKATQADLYNPRILMNYMGKENKRKGGYKKTAQFFETLHDISEIIDVPDFNILHGNLLYATKGASPLKMEMKNMNAHILLTNFLVSDSLIDIKRAVPMLRVDTVTLQTPGVKLLINGYSLVGKNKDNLASNFQVMLANGSSIKGKYLYWELLDWDQLVNHQSIDVETLLVKEITINSKSGAKHTKIKLPRLNIHRFDTDHLNYQNIHPNYSIHFIASAAGMENISSENNYLVWNKANATIQDLVFNNNNSLATIGKINFKNDETVLYETALAHKNDNGEIKVMIPEMNILAGIYTTNFSLLHLASLHVSKPQIDIHHNQIKQKAILPAAIKIPLNFITDKFIIEDATIRQSQVNEKDTSTILTNASINISNLQSKSKDTLLISYANAVFNLSDFQFKNHLLTVDIPQISGSLLNGTIGETDNRQLIFKGGLVANWFHAAIKLQKPGQIELEAIHINGNLKDPLFLIHPNKKLQWQQLVNHTQLNNAKVLYKNNTLTAKADSIEWEPILKTFSTKRYSVIPNLDEAETFKKAKWQADYLTLEGEAISISGLQFNQLHRDSAVTIKKIIMANNTLQATRDRNIPFRHNIEKLMPGALLHTLKKRIQVDSIFVKTSHISVHEIGLKTNKKTTIPITDLNAVITHFNNIREDSLTIIAQASVLNNKVSNFYYKEANKDSLSYFQVKVNAAPMQLTNFNDATIPIASIRIKKGNADTLFAAWAGNKHAAAGTMNFYYDNLKIQLLDKNDAEKNRFILSIASNLSSLVFRKKNDKPALIYYIRDKEKFVFNYWVKTIASGILTSAGFKKNKQYNKQYNAVKELYSLPEISK